MAEMAAIAELVQKEVWIMAAPLAGALVAKVTKTIADVPVPVAAVAGIMAAAEVVVLEQRTIPPAAVAGVLHMRLLMQQTLQFNPGQAHLPVTEVTQIILTVLGRAVREEHMMGKVVLMAGMVSSSFLLNRVADTHQSRRIRKCFAVESM